MNEALKNILLKLLHHHVIGGKHIPERIVITKKIMRLGKYERREFFKDYKSLINQGFILRQKKRTGKGYEEHICLNPAYTDEIKSWLGHDDEVNDDEDRGFL